MKNFTHKLSILTYTAIIGLSLSACAVKPSNVNSGNETQRSYPSTIKAPPSGGVSNIPPAQIP